jgi:steroid 5-alpha reductase family enzyme
MLASILYSAASIFIYMNLVFLVALVMKDNSILDIAWGIGFILVAALTFFLEPGATSLHILIAVLILLWGIRLASHIAVRNRGRREDWRYARWRRDWGKWFMPRVYAQGFLLQGLLLLIISYPIILVNSSQQSKLGPLVILGTLLWLVGFVFEAVGDYQLLRFKRNPENRGKLMTRGLWKYTRHPNYFGECVMWWGIFFIALSIPRGWTAVISPLLITLLLLRVSGVTMLEKKYKDNQEFSEYSRRTSAFVPWFPKK